MKRLPMRRAASRTTRCTRVSARYDRALRRIQRGATTHHPALRPSCLPFPRHPDVSWRAVIETRRHAASHPASAPPPVRNAPDWAASHAMDEEDAAACAILITRPRH